MSNKIMNKQDNLYLQEQDYDTLVENGTLTKGSETVTYDVGNLHLIPFKETIIETHTIATTDWTALSSSDPYTYQATITATATIGANSIVELFNDNAILFATYGFAIGSVSGQNITIYSIGQPSASVTLTMGIGG